MGRCLNTLLLAALGTLNDNHANRCSTCLWILLVFTWFFLIVMLARYCCLYGVKCSSKSSKIPNWISVNARYQCYCLELNKMSRELQVTEVVFGSPLNLIDIGEFLTFSHSNLSKYAPQICFIVCGFFSGQPLPDSMQKLIPDSRDVCKVVPVPMQEGGYVSSSLDFW